MRQCAVAVLMLVILTSVGQADWVTTTVAAGGAPYAVAVNPVTNKIYVANSGSANVTVIDGATNGAVTVAVGSNPYAVAVNTVTNKIYVANENSSNVTVIDGATNVPVTVAAGTWPWAVAVNPVTNKIYVVNSYSANVTVIDGATNGIATVAVGANPRAVAVNPVTNKIYVANFMSANVTVIDGATNGTTTVAAGSRPYAVAVNPVTNKIYVANRYSNDVTVIDGATNGTVTVAAGNSPFAVAVNPVTNKIYVANNNSNIVTVIDGATNGTVTVAAGTYPYAVAVNPVTNKIYVANSVYGSNNVTVIDGATNGTVTVAVGTNPWAVAVNPVTNKIYAANLNSNNVTVIDGSTNGTATVAAGSYPCEAAVNPVTNKIYVANGNSANVTVIDGATNGTVTVAAGSTPFAVAVNPVTNKIYVANRGSASVTVIDGATNGTTAVTVGNWPLGVAVNPVTDKIYVANLYSNNVTVIDGATNGTVTVAVGNSPTAVAVNPVTNKIYVTNGASPYGVRVIDGATNDTTTVAAGTYPWRAAVNPVTNKIYVANGNSANVTVIDGATNGTTTVAVGNTPYGVAVNPVTNKIYVANANSANVTVIDGATNGTVTVAAGANPRAVAVNTVTNKIYVANYGSANVTVIDGATNGTVTVAAGTLPAATAVNPVTNKSYVANGQSANVTVITDAPDNDTKVRAEVAPVPGNVAIQARPTVSGKAVNRSTPNRPKMLNAGNRLNTAQQSWRWASVTSGGGSDSLTWSWNWSTDSLIRGENFLCVEPLDSTTGTTNNLGLGTPFCGNLHVYPLYRVDGHDVGLTWIALTLDSAGPLVPACSVYNYGRLAETYSVRMKVGGAYEQTAPVNSHQPGTAVYLTFPTYYGPRGSPAISCTTELDGDMWRLNDRRTGSAAVRVTDAGVVAIVAPVGTVDSGTALTPQANVRNNGTANATFNVRFDIGTWNNTQTVTGLAPGATQLVNFSAWTATQRGANAIRCTTMLAGDAVSANDLQTGSVDVRVLDAQAVLIVAPTGTVDSGTALTPQANVRNNGTANATFNVRFDIGTWNNTQTVTGLAPGATQLVNFSAWTATQRGANAIRCTTMLADDAVSANDLQTGSVDVRVLDAEALAIIAPAGAVDSGVPITPQARVRNNGTGSATFNVRLDIGAWTNTQTVTGLAAGNSQVVNFASWTPTQRGSFGTACTTMLSGDLAPGNNRITGSFAVRIVDVGVVAIVAPAGAIDSGFSVAPACSVFNFGTQAATFNVRMWIGATYDHVALVSDLASGTRTRVTFSPNWIALPRGSVTARCSTELDNDAAPDNDAQQVAVTVVVRDAQTVSIDAPAGLLSPGAVVAPRARVRNNGTAASSFDVVFHISDGYSSLRTVNNLAPAADLAVSFDNWTAPNPGGYASACTTRLSNDLLPGNDWRNGTFAVALRDTGWTGKSELPLGTKSKSVKDGGALAYGREGVGGLGTGFGDGGDTGYVYAFKGNNTYEFYRYNTLSNVWLSRESIPAKNRNTKKKGVKKGSSLVMAGDGKIYATKGNNTLDWWQYGPATRTWTQKADVPTGAKACKEGVGTAAVETGGSDYVYLLRGSGTYDFYRYNTATDAWDTSLPTAPGGASTKAYKNGSSIACDGNDTIYCLKGSYNEFAAYSISGKTWVTKDPLPLVAPPGTRKKKVKDGSQIAHAGNVVYALKGGNTNEFWMYKTDEHKWYTATELTAGSKRVKGGGALVASREMTALYAFRGNNTREFWQFGPIATFSYPLGAGSQPKNVQNQSTARSPQFALGIAPNPFTSSLNPSISYSLPIAGDVSLRLYDVTGKLVSTLASGYRTAGSYSTGLSAVGGRLSAGVYLLKFETEGYNTTEKLIIE